MHRYAIGLSLGLAVFGIGCGASEDGVGEADQAVIEVSAVQKASEAGVRPEPRIELPTVHLQLAVSETRVHVLPRALRTLDLGGDRADIGDDEPGLSDDMDEADEPGDPDEPAGNIDFGEPDELDEDDGLWVSIPGETRFDFYTGRPAEIPLGAAPIPAGQITQTRLVLMGEPLMWIGDQRVKVTCPSCAQSGLKLIPKGDVIVPPGGTVIWKLVFDMDLLGKKPDGFKLGPVIHVDATVVR